MPHPHHQKNGKQDQRIPSGPALKLLDIVRKHGLRVLT
jgi:DNA-binding transcriptional regulator YiaG